MNGECGNEIEKNATLYEGNQRHERYIETDRQREREVRSVVDITLKYVRHTHLLYTTEKNVTKKEEHYDFRCIVAVIFRAVAVLHVNCAHR